ncbi:MAG: ABC transporter ATP-binding protein [Elusimicrobia bacterium]|nr:ABC transporter ATP-binding protein [Elusimicrobiota bacterium]
MSNTIFALRNVHYAHAGKFPALCGIDLTVTAGEKIAVIGANGTGKSTLLSLLDGLIFPDAGRIEAFGRELTEDALQDEKYAQFFRKKIGFVFQNPDVQLFCPTVKEDIVFGPLQLGVSMEETLKRLTVLAELLEITDLLDRAPHQLSIGEKRKAAIAAVWAIDPDIILLDEPTAGLDPLTTRHIVDLITLASSQGKTIITATHDLHIISEISDTVYLFDKSRKIISSGRPETVLADDEFLKKNNLLHIHRHEHKDTVHSHPHLHPDTP